MSLSPRAGAILVAMALAVSFLAGCTVPWSPEGKNQRSGPGDDALDYIRGSPYSKLHIVIDYVPGAEPNQGAVDVLVATAKEVLDKREVTVAKHGDIPAKGKDHAYSFAAVNDIEKQYRSEYTDGDTAVLYILYLDGHSDRDTNQGAILGAAYHGSSIVMFKNTVRKAVDQNRATLSKLLPIGASQAQMETIVERAILVHEMGHIIGLVDNGIPMQTDRVDKDPAHTPKHSTNKDSVMYWAVESTGGLQGYFQDNTDLPYKFDANDKADIEAAKKGG